VDPDEVVQLAGIRDVALNIYADSCIVNEVFVTTQEIGENDDQVHEAINVEIVPINEEVVEGNEIHVATKNLKRKRVDAFGPGEEPAHLM
jgi:hypothetical protein